MRTVGDLSHLTVDALAGSGELVALAAVASNGSTEASAALARLASDADAFRWLWALSRQATSQPGAWSAFSSLTSPLRFPDDLEDEITEFLSTPVPAPFRTGQPVPWGLAQQHLLSCLDPAWDRTRRIALSVCEVEGVLVVGLRKIAATLLAQSDQVEHRAAAHRAAGRLENPQEQIEVLLHLPTPLDATDIGPVRQAVFDGTGSQALNQNMLAQLASHLDAGDLAAVLTDLQAKNRSWQQLVDGGLAPHLGTPGLTTLLESSLPEPIITRLLTAAATSLHEGELTQFATWAHRHYDDEWTQPLRASLERLLDSSYLPPAHQAARRAQALDGLRSIALGSDSVAAALAYADALRSDEFEPVTELHSPEEARGVGRVAGRRTQRSDWQAFDPVNRQLLEQARRQGYLAPFMEGTLAGTSGNLAGFTTDAILADPPTIDLVFGSIGADQLLAEIEGRTDAPEKAVIILDATTQLDDEQTARLASHVTWGNVELTRFDG